MTSLGWLLDEDKAVKDKVSGVTIPDMSGQSTPGPATQVKTWFRFPEAEQRDITFPFIAIDFVGLSRASDREHRGTILPGYDPRSFPGTTPTADNVLVTSYPIPWDFDYQITTYCRNAQHDRYLLGQLLGNYDRLPPRFGFLNVETTIRRLDLLSVQPSDYLDANGKRVFRKVLLVRTTSERPASQVLEIAQIKKLRISLGSNPPGQFPAETLSYDF